ncbi:hypothetical protein [Labrys neptuniae]
MYSRLCATLSAVLLCSCVATHDTSTLPNRNLVSLSNAEIEIVKRDLVKSLKGAASATYGRMHASSDGKWVYVCGLVNGTNRLGTPSGMEPYFGILEGPPGNPTVFSPIILGTDGNKQAEIDTMCAKFGTYVEQFPM